MYGGDEVSAIVVDLGSHTCKAGYAGEDAPKAVFPSVVGAIDGMDIDDAANTMEDAKTNVVESAKEKGKRKLYVGSQALHFRRDQMEILSPTKDGIVADWDMVDNIWDHAFRNCLMIDPKEHPMLLAEPPLNSQQQREKAAEIMFEKYKLPALFTAKNPVLTSFASGRATSLVVDWSVKTVTYESLNNIARCINGVSALLLTVLPGKANILEGLHGWELRPTLRGPRLPRWMHNEVSSFNHFIHELSVDSDTSSLEYSGEGSDGALPASPSSHGSRRSSASASASPESHWTEWIMFILWWIVLPLRILLWVPQYFLRLFYKRISRTPMSPRRPRISKTNSSKDHDVPNRTTDRRRGVIEDLHLAIEICIEAIFDFFHEATHLLLSPSGVFAILLPWFSSPSHSRKNNHSDISDDETGQTATLGDTNPSLTERPTERSPCLYHSMNTDTRTCQDVITELGYPYEAIRVVTSDGYVVLLERIPRRDARKAVFLQHGIFDSSMGWVSNGVVGSPAFAAYDQGYDVFLGNFRGLVSRDHVNKNISSKEYWQYSINEHGTEDIPAMIERIHEIKTTELKLCQPNIDEEINQEEPYKLCAVCHSLGGAAILMYVITQKIKEKPHRLSRLILLSPAGFHEDSNLGFTLVEYIFLFISPVLARIVPAFYVPTRFFRMLLNKLARDFHNYPALGGLVQTLMSYVVGGDSSNWVGVLGLPHYNMNDMPAVSFRVAQHLSQIKHSGKFKMYDYGSISANMEVYSSPEPLDLGECYKFIDVPVDLVAGIKDKVIRPSMVKKHYKVMKDAEVDVSISEFEYAHLDFTFSHREELLRYVMSRLLLVEQTPGQQRHTMQKSMKLNKKKDVQ